MRAFDTPPAPTAPHVQTSVPIDVEAIGADYSSTLTTHSLTAREALDLLLGRTTTTTTVPTTTTTPPPPPSLYERGRTGVAFVTEALGALAPWLTPVDIVRGAPMDEWPLCAAFGVSLALFDTDIVAAWRAVHEQPRHPAWGVLYAHQIRALYASVVRTIHMPLRVGGLMNASMQLSAMQLAYTVFGVTPEPALACARAVTSADLARVHMQADALVASAWPLPLLELVVDVRRNEPRISGLVARMWMRTCAPGLFVVVTLDNGRRRNGYRVALGGNGELHVSEIGTTHDAAPRPRRYDCVVTRTPGTRAPTLMCENEIAIVYDADADTDTGAASPDVAVEPALAQRLLEPGPLHVRVRFMRGPGGADPLLCSRPNDVRSLESLMRHVQDRLTHSQDELHGGRVCDFRVSGSASLPFCMRRTVHALNPEQCVALRLRLQFTLDTASFVLASTADGGGDLSCTTLVLPPGAVGTAFLYASDQLSDEDTPLIFSRDTSLLSDDERLALLAEEGPEPTRAALPEATRRSRFRYAAAAGGQPQHQNIKKPPTLIAEGPIEPPRGHPGLAQLMRAADDPANDGNGASAQRFPVWFGLYLSNIHPDVHHVMLRECEAQLLCHDADHYLARCGVQLVSVFLYAEYRASASLPFRRQRPLVLRYALHSLPHAPWLALPSPLEIAPGMPVPNLSALL